MAKVAVLGAGSWATALAKLLADKGNDVWLWSRSPAVTEGVERNHMNERYLPGIPLPATLRATTDPHRALVDASSVVLAVPSHAMRQVLTDLSPLFPPAAYLVSATKGIETESLMLMHEVAVDVFGPSILPRYACLSGPSFAQEVAQRFPSAVVVAGAQADVVQRAQQAFAGDTFRVYSSTDVCGVEIGGALKNVIAIAAGAADGLGFGHNTRAALLTRGLAEIARLVLAKGGSPLTVAGLAGMGDLVLTCTGELSRNRTVGFAMGRGQTLEETLHHLGHVAEGVKTAKSAHDLARVLDLDMPITREVYLALYEGKAPSHALGDLMNRAPRAEWDPTNP